MYLLNVFINWLFSHPCCSYDRKRLLGIVCPYFLKYSYRKHQQSITISGISQIRSLLLHIFRFIRSYHRKRSKFYYIHHFTEENKSNWMWKFSLVHSYQNKLNGINFCLRASNSSVCYIVYISISYHDCRIWSDSLI